MNGVVFVYNPDNQQHMRELDNWHLHFAKEIGLKDKQCIILGHQKPGMTAKGKLTGALSRVPLVTSNIEEDPDAIRDGFKHFLGSVLAHMNNSREQEELSIIE